MIHEVRCKPNTLGRRTFLRGILAGAFGVVSGMPLSGCTVPPQRRLSNEPAQSPPPAIQSPVLSPVQSTATGTKTLLVYFSRAGENYYYGGRTRLTVGNTQVLAEMISALIQCDVHRIEPVDPYPDDYMETVVRNVQEQNANARPAIANPLASLAAYDTVLLGSPIWNVRPPMIMKTFVEGFDFAGKTVIPFVTYAVSGMGTAVQDYTAACPGATIGEGIAVRGEEVRDAGVAVQAWLQRTHLLAK